MNISLDNLHTGSGYFSGSRKNPFIDTDVSHTLRLSFTIVTSIDLSQLKFIFDRMKCLIHRKF